MLSVSRPGNIAANGLSELRCPLPASEKVTNSPLTAFAVPCGIISSTLAYFGGQYMAGCGPSPFGTLRYPYSR